jgi:hypothetical protein
VKPQFWQALASASPLPSAVMYGAKAPNSKV